MKILAIAWKDLSIQFRDRNALLLMIAAPLVLSAIIGASFGSFLLGGSSTPFDAIPTLVINADEGERGQQFVAALQSEGLAELLLVTETADLAAARALVQRGEARTAVYIPPDFSAALESGTAPGSEGEVAAVVRFYADPAATLTPNIVRGVVLQLVNAFNSGGITARVTLAQLRPQAETLGPAMAQIGPALETAVAEQIGNGGAITLREIAVGEAAAATAVSPFAFFAPSMGILFLMFAMMDTTRSILEEEREKTLDRLLATPTGRSALLLGKIGGVFLAGIVQFTLFVFASRLLFGLDWGHSPGGLALMVLAIVSAYAGLGLLIAAFARDVNQAAIVGSVIALVFAALGGNFVAAQNFPQWLEQLSKLTINRWGLDGMVELTINGGSLADVLNEAGVLLALAALFFTLAWVQFSRRIRK